jgi:hypothetical protein
MATVILTTIGSAFGPIGAAIGALAGQAIDGQIFRPEGREGPRLADLRIQTSSYGTQIPALFGRMRVAGTVIWASDLREHSDRSGGGKGQPTVTTYSYSASLAVALSSRTIGSIRRIWADGNLLRGAAGDFKSKLGAFRVHDGGADQPVDPLIAADRSVTRAPAHRGIAYVLFEDLALEDFGNRIPSLTFEVIADPGAVGVDLIAGRLAGGVAVEFAGEGSVPTLGGYAASGANAAEAVQPIFDAHALCVRATGEAMTLTAGVRRALSLRDTDDLRMAGGAAVPGRDAEHAPVDAIPRRLSVRHYDPARDYQAGVQAAERQGTGQAEAQIDLPAALSAEEARACAQALLRRQGAGRHSATLSRGWQALVLDPGDCIGLEGSARRWRIETREWEGMAVRLSLVAVPGHAGATAIGTDGGSGIGEPDGAVGPSHVAVVETPQLSDSPVDRPQIIVAASGEGRAWRGAAILIRDADGGHSGLGGIRRPAVLGRTLSVLPPASPHMIDARSTVDIIVHDADAVLAPASDAALIDGANACMIGEELVQFGHVQTIGPRTYRLSRLLRGRRGSEARMHGHGVGEICLLLDGQGLLPVPDGYAVRGRLLTVIAQGVGDAVPAEANRTADGRAMLPLSPAHLRVAGDAITGFSLGWIRRSRLGWQWSDGGDAALGEEREAYSVVIRAGERLLRSETTMVPSWYYAPDAVAADAVLADPDPMRVAICQIGTHGQGAVVERPLIPPD